MTWQLADSPTGGKKEREREKYQPRLAVTYLAPTCLQRHEWDQKSIAYLNVINNKWLLFWAIKFGGGLLQSIMEVIDQCEIGQSKNPRADIC